MAMKNVYLIIISLISISVQAQRIHVGLFGGASAYNGELATKLFPKKVTNGAVGFTLNYEATDNLFIRAGVTYSIVGGADRYSNKADVVLRNLSFETTILEFSAVGEYNLLNLYESRYTPYLFAGFAMYKFNPYDYDLSGQKIFLKPLSTEGQGLSSYPDRNPYNLTQLAIPFGGGVKFALNDNIRVGLEMGLRYLFTDYLDDVSTSYIDRTDLLAAKGQVAVDMSYRGDEVTGGSLIYPAKGEQRGSPKAKDYYYFSGLHLTYRLGAGGGSGNARKSHTGCPVNVY